MRHHLCTLRCHLALPPCVAARLLRAVPCRHSHVCVLPAAVRAFVRGCSYVGELGWELYVRTEAALTVYEAIKNAAAAMGLGEAG